MTEETKNLTRVIAMRVTQKDAELMEEQAKLRGFRTTEGFVRQVILRSLAEEEEPNHELELLLQIRFMLAENFLAVTPEEEQSNLEKIRERAEAGSLIRWSIMGQNEFCFVKNRGDAMVVKRLAPELHVSYPMLLACVAIDLYRRLPLPAVRVKNGELLGCVSVKSEKNGG